MKMQLLLHETIYKLLNSGAKIGKRLRIYTLPFIVKVLTFAP